MRYRSTGRLHSWLALTLTLVLAAAATAGAREAAPRPEVPVEGAATLSGAEVPFALRAESFVSGLARLRRADLDEGTDHADRFLRTVGLDADSVAGRELLELALTLEEAQPRTAPDAGAFDAGAQRQWVAERYRRVGEGLGAWLRTRQAEGWAIDPLLDRMLNGAHIEVIVFSTDDDFAARVDEDRRALETSIQRELGYLPRRLEN